MDKRWKDFSEDLSNKKWTELMKEVIQEIAERSNCYCFTLKPERLRDEFHEEYLGIDCIYIDKCYIDKIGQLWVEDWCPPVPPTVVIEHENEYKRGKIVYCLWKILSVRAELKILICYQSNADNVKYLADFLEKFVLNGGFMRNDDSELLILIGDDSKVKLGWRDYFNIFEWRSDGLEKIRV